MPVDTWVGGNKTCICPSCCPSWASGAPENPMVAFHSRSKMESCGVELLVAEMPPSLSRMKRRGKPWRFLTQSRGALEKEVERSAQLELSLLLCLWGSGCCCWGAILTLQELPLMDSLETKAFSLYHFHSFSTQSSGWIIYKGTKAFNGCLVWVCLHLIAGGGEKYRQQPTVQSRVAWESQLPKYSVLDVEQVYWHLRKEWSGLQNHWDFFKVDSF